MEKAGAWEKEEEAMGEMNEDWKRSRITGKCKQTWVNEVFPKLQKRKKSVHPFLRGKLHLFEPHPFCRTASHPPPSQPLHAAPRPHRPHPSCRIAPTPSSPAVPSCSLEEGEDVEGIVWRLRAKQIRNCWKCTSRSMGGRKWGGGLGEERGEEAR